MRYNHYVKYGHFFESYLLIYYYCYLLLLAIIKNHHDIIKNDLKCMLFINYHKKYVNKRIS